MFHYSFVELVSHGCFEQKVTHTEGFQHLLFYAIAPALRLQLVLELHSDYQVKHATEQNATTCVLKRETSVLQLRSCKNHVSALQPHLSDGRPI